ncbi:plant pleckstrin-like region protein [Medicago truncatula]|uniref:Plant pleckstrin-like region protein n=1 Tax=Medicago truncatula TaxID=3880 RepID=A0A072USW6_MEDTR|nr:plant pleckstrin-like region protein [Medicago truncatula]
MKSTHVAGTIKKKKRNVVIELIKDMPAWTGRHLLDGGENRRYFGLESQPLIRGQMRIGIHSIKTEGRVQAKKFGVEQYEMRTFSRDRHFLENLIALKSGYLKILIRRILNSASQKITVSSAKT